MARPSQRRADSPGRGYGAARIGWRDRPRRRSHGGRRLPQRDRAGAGTGSADRVLPSRARRHRGAGADLRASICPGRSGAARRRRAHGRVLAGDGGPARRPRHHDLSRLLGADDSRSRGRDPRGAARRLGPRRGVRIPGDHTPRRGGSVGRNARARPLRRHRRSSRPRPGRYGRADPGGRGRPGGLWHEGWAGPAALVAAACPPDGSRPPVGADVRGDDQGRPVRADPGRVPVARGNSAMAWADTAGAGAALCPRRGAVGARPARPQASARVPFHRERRHHRPRSRGLPPVRARGDDRVGGDRVRRCTTARGEPRDLQGAAVHGCGRLRAGGRLTGPGSARRPDAPYAVDGRSVPARCDVDRGAATLERLRLGVADPSIPHARGAARAALGRAGGRDRACGPGRHRRPGADVLCEGCRPGAAGTAATSGVRRGDRSAPFHAHRNGRCWQRCAW